MGVGTGWASLGEVYPLSIPAVSSLVWYMCPLSLLPALRARLDLLVLSSEVYSWIRYLDVV